MNLNYIKSKKAIKHRVLAGLYVAYFRFFHNCIWHLEERLLTLDLFTENCLTRSESNKLWFTAIKQERYSYFGLQ